MSIILPVVIVSSLSNFPLSSHSETFNRNASAINYSCSLQAQRSPGTFIGPHLHQKNHRRWHVCILMLRVIFLVGLETIL